MSLGSIWCSIWSRVLNAFNDVVETVVSAVKSVGELVIELLSDLASSLTSNPFGYLLMIGGVLLILNYLPLGKEDDKKSKDGSQGSLNGGET